MPLPVASVIIPAFNAEAFLAEALESVLAQDFAPFEVLVCDDASRDGTWRVMQDYAQRIVPLRLSANVGSGRARNELLKRAQGQFVVLLDADDVLLPGALSRIAQAFGEHPQAGVVYGQVRYQDELISPAPACAPNWDLLGCNLSNSGTGARTSLLRQLGGYDESLACAEDWDLWLRAAEVSQLLALPDFCSAVFRRRAAGRSRSLSQALQRATIRRILEAAIQRRYGLKISEAAWETEQDFQPAISNLHPVLAEQTFRLASSEILGKVIDDEAIVLNLATGNYYSLEDSGALIWQRLEAGDSVAQIEERLLQTYQADREEIRSDLESLLQNLLANGLIEAC